jgi:hypothetical protein
MIITFFYRIRGKNRMYYGKYIGAIQQHYEEGLDIELRNLLLPIFKKSYPFEVSDEEHITIGIIGFNRDTTDYFSENEKNMFDLLFCNWSNQPSELFLYGKSIPLDKKT